MNRISYIDIAGKKCPMNFSLGAVTEVSQRYGGLEEMQAAFSGIDKKPMHEALADLLWILSVLLKYGAKYAELTGTGDGQAYSAEDLAVLFGVEDAGTLSQALTAAMSLGAAVTLEVEDEPKNGEATPGR